MRPRPSPLARWFATLALSLPLSVPLTVSFPLAAQAAGGFQEALAAYRGGDYARALKLARPLADKNNTQAMYLLGVIYEQGKGVTRDEASAMKWYAAAAAKGNYASAEYNLARMYLAGRGSAKDEAKARELLQAAAAQGHPESVQLLEQLGTPGRTARADAPAPVTQKRTQEQAQEQAMEPSASADSIPSAESVAQDRAATRAQAQAYVSASTAASAPAAAPAPASASGSASSPTPASSPVSPPASPSASSSASSSAPSPSSTSSSASAQAEPPVLKAYLAEDYARAVKLARPLAAREDGVGMYVLGKLYEEGNGVKRDDYAAVKWLAAASRQADYAPAQYALARMYLDGRGVGRSRDRALEWLRTAAEAGYQPAQRLLAELTGNNRPVAAQVRPQAVDAGVAAAPVANAAPPASSATRMQANPVADPATAPAIASNERTASVTAPAAAPAASSAQAAPAYASTSSTVPADGMATPPRPAGPSLFGNLVFGDYKAGYAQAAIDRLKAAGARSQHQSPEEARATLQGPLAQAALRLWEAEAAGERLGMEQLRDAILSHGALASGVGRSWRQSGDGNALAAGALLATLTQGGTGADQEACRAYIASAQAVGSDLPPAQYHAAICVAEKDARQSLAWFHAAADAGHAAAQETLGRACIEGAEKNWGCAQFFFETAARHGRASSMALYGWALSNQPSAGSKELAEAVGWYRKSAQAGDLFAQNNLGEMYERGRGLPRDDKQAREWYGRAAQAGLGAAQFNYARMLLAGAGGPVDRDGAVQWLRKAESNGVAQARNALEQIGAARRG